MPPKKTSSKGPKKGQGEGRTPQGGKNPPKSNKSAAPSGNASSQQSRAPSWTIMGKSSVRFVAAARSLSEHLHRTYGEEISISKFEKALIELRSKPELKDKIHLTDETLRLHVEYISSKKAKIEEQNLFKTTFSGIPVESHEIRTLDDIWSSGPSDDGPNNDKSTKSAKSSETGSSEDDGFEKTNSANSNECL